MLNCATRPLPRVSKRFSEIAGTYFLVDVDLMTCMWTSPWIWFAVDAMVRDFRECFEKSLYGRNLLPTIQNLSFLSFHGTSDSPPMKGYF